MQFTLQEMKQVELNWFIDSMQEAFQKGFEDVYGKTDQLILPVEDIEMSLHSNGACALIAYLDDEPVGGAIVCIDEQTQCNHLDFLFVKYGIQGKGIGKQIWHHIETKYPKTRVWETCTPYFEKRNIHFYVNVCGFYITEFYNEKHPDPHSQDDFNGDGGDGMFELKKFIGGNVL